MRGEGAPLGAAWQGGESSEFLVWAPFASRVEVEVMRPGSTGRFELAAGNGGYHSGAAPGRPGDRYAFRLDGGPPRPDPASRFQPDGVHGPSAILDPAFAWTDGAWRGMPLERCVFYELHVGTFTHGGTFDAVVPHLRRLADFGITALELMPVAQFPGSRNWGYDGVAPYAVQSSYGGPEGLKRLVDACHAAGLAAVLDVVYNHLGPEGNYLKEFGPYFTSRYRTPWGEAINFDGNGSDEVRRFFLENALRWIAEFHFDGLRLDAVHAIRDHSARPFLAELAEALHAEGTRLSRPVLAIAESDLNDSRLVRPGGEGGYGLDAVWSDDFHHSLHVLSTGESGGYYLDFSAASDLSDAFENAFVYRGKPSAYRGRRHGNSTDGVPGERFVVFAQNHDQVGNRMRGERLSAIAGLESQKVAAAAVLLSPYLPLLFMGEEYGETAPFLYFVSHGDPGLIEAVRKGRAEEFSEFAWAGDPPDPQAVSTFTASRLDHELAGAGAHRALFEFYRELLRLRREVPALGSLDREAVEARAFDSERAATVVRRRGGSEALLVLGFARGRASLPIPGGRAWRRAFDSADARWGGPGAIAPSCIPDEEGRARIRLEGPEAVLYLAEA